MYMYIYIYMYIYMRPAIGVFDPSNLDEASDRIPPTSQLKPSRIMVHYIMLQCVCMYVCMYIYIYIAYWTIMLL